MKVLILGEGVSGKSAYNFLKKKGYDVQFAEDEKVVMQKSLQDNKFLDRLFCGLSFIVVSPGIPLDNFIIKNAKKRKIKILGELELGAREIKGDIIAVTGTNGKTTTVSLINFILTGTDKTIFLGGNIGTAVTSFADKTESDDISILECSSYQLESSKKFKPHISAILNITPDHLIRHKTMKNYIKAKQKIAQNQTENDFMLINFDDEILMQNLPKTRAKTYFFSTKQKVFGCYIKSGCIYFNDNQKSIKLVSLKNIKLIGEHNLSNILCACLAVYLETGCKKTLSRISQFQGVNHRIEYVKTIDGVQFYNDSKATNIDSTLVALKCFNGGICLILGGSEKGYDFDNLFKCLPKNVKYIAVFGETKFKIIQSAKKYHFNSIFKFDDLKSCVLACFRNAEQKDIVLLSPACASFDQFKNFEERGNVFKKIVKEIKVNENSLFESKKTL